MALFIVRYPNFYLGLEGGEMTKSQRNESPPPTGPSTSSTERPVLTQRPLATTVVRSHYPSPTQPKLVAVGRSMPTLTEVLMILEDPTTWTVVEQLRILLIL